MNNNNFINNLKKIYSQETYLDKYGGSVLFTFFIVLIFFLIFAYFLVRTNIKSLRNNWNENKCKPYVIPFAGLINKDPKKNSMEYTEENFAECTYSILTYIMGEFLEPIYYSVNNFHEMLKTIEDTIQNARKMFAYIRNVLSSIVMIIMARILNVLMPLQHSFIKFKSIFGKINGILTTALFTVFGSFLTMKSFLRSFVQILIIALVALAAAIVIMWIIPFTWPVAAATTTFFLAVSIPLAMILASLQHIIYLTERSVPNKPSCFDENTIIATKKGPVKIKDLQPNSVLRNGDVVTSVLKLYAKNENMYYLDDVIVSGTHQVLLNNKIIFVNEHPDSILLDSYDKSFIYCITTTSKKIRLNNTIFLDWDELTREEFKQITSNCHFKFSNYEELQGGFHGNTTITMKHNKTKPIRDVKIGDILEDGGVVYGIVKLPKSKIHSYFIKDETILCNNHLFVAEECLAKSIYKFVSLPKDEYENVQIYNLVTSTGFIKANNIKFYDFNGCLDCFLENQ